MAALTGGTFQISAAARISGATIAPQGDASSNGLSSPTADATGSGQQNTDYGTASSQADILCAGDFDIPAGGTLTIDIYTGSDLPNVFGGAAPFRTLRSVLFAITAGGDSSGVVVGNAASNANQMFFGAQTHTWTIFPSGPPLVGGSDAGVAVDATHKNINLHNAGAADATVRIMLAGGSV